jgi:hypothetical protein
VNNLELTHFRTELIQDLTDAVIADDAGGIREEKFTSTVLEYLEDAGETEGAVPCREIRENSIGNRIHKINGYAVSEGYETIDLFITIFKGVSKVTRIYSDELKSAVSLSTRFLLNILVNKMEGIEDTAPVFDFVNTVRKIASDIVRVNIYILSDVLVPFEPPAQTEVGEIRVFYHIRDIEYLYRIHTSGSGRQPIEIDFQETFDETIPCLQMPVSNSDYKSYLAFVPARILADTYRDFGSRLLEQNIRTFLQFRGTINKGIRDTILREPQMFAAYNNGISATAESVHLSDGGDAIIAIKDFQIVNGGQTTASIFQTRRKFKDANLDLVCVQVKLTVINDPLKKPEIVSNISRYANTQNKVSEADLSSNHPFHIDLENLSRKIWAPASAGRIQTRWFYERARGQYNDELSKIDAAGQQKKWLDRNPKSQKYAKEDLARFYSSWEMTPWWVVRGRQRNFIEFMAIVDDLDTGQIFYEDMIAKAIVFRSAERLYGAGPKAIGDLRYMVVPYTVSWLRVLTGNRINLLRIWKRQILSKEFESLLYDMLVRVDEFMRNTAPGGLIGEWAKKEDCWKKLRSQAYDLDLSVLKPDLYSEADIKARYTQDHKTLAGQRDTIEQKVRSITSEDWIRMDQSGKASGRLDILQSNFIWRIIRKLEKKKSLTDKDLQQAVRIMELMGR